MTPDGVPIIGNVPEVEGLTLAIDADFAQLKEASDPIGYGQSS